MKTLTQLKKDASSGAISLELLPVGNWKNGVKELLQGKRKCTGANSVSIFLETSKGTSTCYLPKASLVEYDSEYLTIYHAGYRKPDEHEKKALDEWNLITESESYKRKAEMDFFTDTGYTFREKQNFFESRNMGYLMGFKESRGLMLDQYRMLKGEQSFIRDSKIKGEIALQYKVHHI